MVFSRFRQWLGFLRTTPVHPQWLVLRNDIKNQQDIARRLKGHVLDIGCGERRITQFLDREVSYTGLDYPDTHAKGYRGRPEVFGDGQNLPFAEGVFDAVLALDVLEHLPEPDKCVHEACRVLRRGGQFILQTPFLYPLHDMPHDFQRWTMPGLETLVQRNGFEVTERHISGFPCETAAALTAIGLAKACLDSLQQRSPAVLLIPLLIVGVLFANLIGWLLARVLPADDFMPLGYRLVCTRVL